MSKLSFKFIHDPDLVNDFFKSDPIFNLKSDIKNKNIDWENIQEEVIHWIIYGPNPPQYCIHIQDILEGKKIEISKIRIGVDSTKKGKSGGYRVIVFIERRYNVIVVMHLYSKKDKGDITQREKNKLSKWFKEYIASQKKGINT